MGSEQQQGVGVQATLQGVITNPRCGRQPRTRVAHEVELGAHVEGLGRQKCAEAVQVSTAAVYRRGEAGQWQSLHACGGTRVEVLGPAARLAAIACLHGSSRATCAA